MRPRELTVSAGSRSGTVRSSRRGDQEEPEAPLLLLLPDINLCYRLLQRLVPGVPAGRTASRVEILQRVIDYILELQAELVASCPAGEREELRWQHTHLPELTEEEDVVFKRRILRDFL